VTDSIVVGAQGSALGPGDINSGAQFAAALTVLRLDAGRSIRDVARATRIPSATLGGYFSGRHLPPTTQPQQFEVLLAELGVRDPGDVAQWRAALLRARQAGPARVAGQSGTLVGDQVCPYRGLEPFTDRDAALFFGREGVVEDLVAEVETREASTAGPRVVVLVGSSGSGKSSVLRAGLVPRLRDRADRAWAVSVMVPGTNPVAGLAHARAELGPAPRGLLVVDQAEEIFSPLVDSDQRRAFLGQLADLAGGGGTGEGSVVVVAGLRADFYGQALADPDLLPAMRSAQVLLGSMQLEDLRRAVVEPARAVGVSVDPGLVEVLLRDLRPRGQAAPGYDAGALPLVSHALLSTWSHHSGDRLTVADYEAAGGIAGAVQQTAESVVAHLDDSGRAAAQWLFGQLVLVDDDGVMTRRRVSHDDLRHPDPVTDIALDSVIEAFVAGRLLTAGDGTLEISHEALLSAWPRLRDWLLTDLEAARLQRRIADAAAVWRERDRDPATLLRGGLLADARSLAAQPVTSHRTLAAAEQEFVAASSAQEQAEQADARRQTTRLRSLVAVLTVLALLAGTLAFAAVRAGRQATQARDEALSRQLAITAEGLRAKDPALAAQLGLAAYQTSPTVQARSILLDSTGVPTPTRFVGPAGEMRAVASPDGELLALSGSDGVTRLWQAVPQGSSDPDALGGYRLAGELPPIDGPVSVYGSAFHPDGQVLALGTANGEVVLWDLASIEAPRRVAVLDAGDVAVYSLAFSGDGRQLAAGTSAPAVLRWSVPPGDSGEPTQLPKISGPFGGNVQAVDFHPTAALLATGSSDGTLRMWRVPDDGPATLAGQASVGEATNFVHAVAFSPDGNLLASGEKDRAARIWDVREPAEPVQRGEVLGGFGSWVNAVGFSPDGRTLVAGSSDNTVRMFTVADGQPQGSWPTPAVVTSAQFVGSGSALLTGEVAGVARLWPMPGPVLGGFADTVWNIIPSADGALTAVAPGSGDGSVHLLDTTDPADPRTVDVLTPPAEVGPPDGAAGMSADGRWVVAGTAVGKVVVWERDPVAGSARLAGVVTVSDQLVEAAVTSPDGTLLAAVADDGAVGVWSLRPGAPPQPAHDLSVPGLPLGAAFSPDSSLLAVGTTGGQVHLWRLGDPAGATGGAEELPALTGFDNYVYSVAFDPSGRYLAAGSTDRTVRIWDLTDPAAAVPVGTELRGPQDTVYALDWSADGSLLAGASKEGSVWLWDMADPAAPAVQATLTAAEGTMYATALTPDGARVWAAGAPPTLTSWQIDVDQVAANTCTRTGTPMTEAEWQQLVPGVPFTPPCPS
jgi:WD40 repeat protein